MTFVLFLPMDPWKRVVYETHESATDLQESDLSSRRAHRP